MVGANFFDAFVCNPDRSDTRRKYCELVASTSDRTEHSLIKILDAQGLRRTISCNTKLLHDEAGNVTGTLTSAEDVTEVLLVHENLRKSEERYRGYVENAPDAIFITDFSGLCIDVNPAACELVRVSRQEMLTKNFVQFTLGPDIDITLHMLAGATRGQKPNSEITFHPRTGRSVTASVKALRLDENRILWFCTDITDLRHAEFQAVARAQELDEALTQLHSLTAHMHDSIERERLAIATDIHDQVGASLTGAKLLLDQLKRSLPNIAADQRAMLGQACSAVAQALVSSRGVYAQLRPPMLDDLGLVNTMRWYLEDWSQKSGIQVTQDLCELKPEPSAMARMDLFRIFQELLTNVARHAGASVVNVRLQSGKSNLILEVRDDGSGLDLGKKIGFGLQGIRGRLNRYGGTLSIGNGFPGAILKANIPWQGMECIAGHSQSEVEK
jgi:PAS domain S-box-containing protein